MSLSYVQYVADGTTDEFDVTFPFADRTHVKVRINGAFPVLPIRWVGEARIKIAGNLPSGALVELRRETPISSRMVDFQNGSVLTEEELDTAINQIFYTQQELKDLYEDTLGGRLAAIAAGGGYVIPEGADIVEELANYVIATDAAEAVAQAITGIAQNSNTLATLNVGLQSANTTVAGLRFDHDNLVEVVDALAGADPGAGIATLIENEANARIAGDTAITTTLALIGAKSGDNLSFILDTSKTKVSPTETLAARLSAISATDATNAAAILSEQSARVAADGVLATSVTSLDTRLGTAEATILTDRTARIDGDAVLATDISLLGARNGGATAFVLNTSTVQIGGGETLATRLSGIQSTLSSNTAAIATESSTRATAVSALATDISTVSTTVGGLSASVTSLTTSVNGVAARYGVALNVNGYVSGFVQNNSGTVSDFSILADKFRVVVPGVTPKQVFSVDATGVYMTGDVRVDGSLLINGTVTTGGLAANAVTSGNSAYTSADLTLTTSWQTAASCTVTMTGGAARVDFCGLLNGQADSSGCAVNIRLLRNGTLVRESNLTILPGEQSYFTGSLGEYEVVVKTPVTGSFPMFLVDTSGATGSVTYTIELKLGNSNADYATIGQRQIAVTEFRR